MGFRGFTAFTANGFLIECPCRPKSTGALHTLTPTIRTWVCLVCSMHFDAACLASDSLLVVANNAHFTPSLEPSIIIIQSPHRI